MSTAVLEDYLVTHTDIELPFFNGDHMDQKSFFKLYEKAPKGFHAELIEGVVYIRMSTQFSHGKISRLMAAWISEYIDSSEAFDGADVTTMKLGPLDAPEPDLVMFVKPEYGGQVRIDRKGYIVGAPEFVIEIANTTKAMDLGTKKQSYELAGVREYCVILVKESRVIWFIRGRKHFTEMKAKDGIFRSVVFPGLWLGEKELFGKSSKPLLEILQLGMSTPEHAAFLGTLKAKQKTALNGHQH